MGISALICIHSQSRIYRCSNGTQHHRQSGQAFSPSHQSRNEARYENRVGLIKSETAYKVSQKMAEAAAARPDITGTELNEIAKTDPEILESVLQVMEVNNLLDSSASVDLLPDNSRINQLGDKSAMLLRSSPTGN